MKMRNIILPIAIIVAIILTFVCLFIFLPSCFPCIECYEKNLMCYCPDGSFPKENKPYCENKICRNETIDSAFIWDASEGNVKCYVNDTLTEEAIKVNFPYTIYTCVEEICDEV
jgi:hypothetical protein